MLFQRQRPREGSEERPSEKSRIRMSVPRYIYHGTSLFGASGILHGEGILPRKDLSGAFHRKKTTDDEVVTLTDVYGAYYGMQTIGRDRKSDSEIAVLEIDTNRLDKSKFVVDEQYMIDFMKLRGAGENDVEFVSYMARKDREAYKPYMEEGLAAQGILSYHGSIPLSAITRAVSWEPSSNDVIRDLIIDPVPSITTRNETAPRHHAITRWLFAEAITGDDLISRTNVASILVANSQYGTNAPLPQKFEERFNEIEAAIKNRKVTILK